MPILTITLTAMKSSEIYVTLVAIIELSPDVTWTRFGPNTGYKWRIDLGDVSKLWNWAAPKVKIAKSCNGYNESRCGKSSCQKGNRGESERKREMNCLLRSTKVYQIVFVPDSYCIKRTEKWAATCTNLGSSKRSVTPYIERERAKLVKKKRKKGFYSYYYSSWS